MFETKIVIKITKNQARPGINPIFWLKYPMSARQMVFLASQGNKIIQKTPNIEQFCTILKQHFQASGWSSNSASIETRQKVHVGEIGLERPK